MTLTLWRRIFNERRRVVLPLVIVLVANVAVLALVVLPLKRGVSTSHQASLDAAMNLAKARREDVDAKTARASLERGDVELKKFYAEILPHNYAGAIDLLNDLLGDAADEAHLRYQAGSWDREDVRDSSLTKITGQITLTGDYNNIRQFLYDLETAKEFVIVEKVELSQANTVRANNALEVALNVATYYLAEPQPQAAGK